MKSIYFALAAPNGILRSVMSLLVYSVRAVDMATAKVGRKQQSPTWDFWSKCLVVETDCNQICGIVLKGKTHKSENPLRSSHKEANREYLDTVTLAR